jgi:hypothetical protein
MIRHSLRLLAFGAAAMFAAGGEAAAGSCCNCPAPCAPEPVVEVLETHAAAPFYVVDQGPIFTGPGIVSYPTVRKMYQSIGDYPYIGYGHGGYHPQARVAYVDVKRVHRRIYRRAPVVHPLNPRDK